MVPSTSDVMIFVNTQYVHKFKMNELFQNRWPYRIRYIIGWNIQNYSLVMNIVQTEIIEKWTNLGDVIFLTNRVKMLRINTSLRAGWTKHTNLLLRTNIQKRHNYYGNMILYDSGALH